MAGLSDSIEQFIKDLLDADNRIEVKRNELAQYFSCAPSQINYVLATRFSMDRGYLVESRRGGSGYVRIIRITNGETDLLDSLLTRIGSSIDEESAFAIAERLAELGILTYREACIVKAGLTMNALALPVSAKDVLRAGILKSQIVEIFKRLREE